jgi:transposase InsO family protein
MLMDHGAPWSLSADHPHTGLTAWLMRLGIQISHGHPYHPQTQGKDERLHRTLQNELLNHSTIANLTHCQVQFDHWRDIYNFERPPHYLCFYSSPQNDCKYYYPNDLT